MEAEHPLTQQIRLLCRDESHLVEKRTALVNELRQCMHEYYPVALEAFDDWTTPSTWAFVKRFPTPQKLADAGKCQWVKFLHTHRLYRPETYARRIEAFSRATELCGAPSVTSVKSLLAVGLVEQLQIVDKQLKAYQQEIHRLFDQHPSREVFESLPGPAEKLTPRLLGECASARSRFDSADGLHCYAGVAPVRYQSGQMQVVKVRRACNKHLRHTVHLWANASRTQCAWADIYYQRKREQGKSHACALRCLSKRWLKILWKMLETGQTYDDGYHLRNQVKHGSWVLTQCSSTS
jgi:transposase